MQVRAAAVLLRHNLMRCFAISRVSDRTCTGALPPAAGRRRCCVHCLTTGALAALAACVFLLLQVSRMRTACHVTPSASSSTAGAHAVRLCPSQVACRMTGLTASFLTHVATLAFVLKSEQTCLGGADLLLLLRHAQPFYEYAAKMGKSMKEKKVGGSRGFADCEPH